MQLDFSGRRALVTGGSRGIGAAIVDALASAGAEIIATGTDEKTLADAQATSKAAGGKVRYELADFSSSAGMDHFAERMSSERLDILINNAGINRHASIGELSMTDWDAIIGVNLRAPTVLCRAIAPQMASRGYGRIVNIGSIFGNVSRTRRVAYATSKFGILGLTRTVSLDYANRNVLSNLVSPGFIDTEMTDRMLSPAERQELTAAIPMARLGRPEEIASVVLFLASEANTYVTGQQVIADGGFTSV
jgi:NAD(P)-dependent dehydrogenase (short-subunit alcohol dehydrogenase family)